MKRKKESSTAATAALQFVTDAHCEFTTYTYEHNSDHMEEGFGLEGAAQLDVQSEQIFKTLLIDIGERPGHDLATCIVPVTGHLNLKAAAAACGVKKAQMATPQVAERQTGYVVGGISPFGQKISHPTVIDESALEFEEILVSGGRRGLSIGLNPLDLIDLLDAKIAPIAAEGSHPR
ncbi:Cys-tRNA(Pro) deacylase [Alloscardovia theropitheci]|uniref:Cys-tRNA(Pro)/Cys-tRNA(Cys) deacylase n=1 Tax=Alloscardovia theropitheci TaxID=2496842 RepID=A0A4R0QP14_9BIFI|nr:Cys-tRNA(Pro) deacylase [Alloscardovia theropitheci]TCD53934.1 Cys-tRNA(Pro) deacylase [Alloscardovia theropitheci]